MPDLSQYQWFTLILAGFFAGFSKTSSTGLGILITPLMVDAFPAKTTIGILLPIYLLASIHACIKYYPYTQWKLYKALSLPTALGLALGVLTISHISELQLRIFICLMVLSILFFNLCMYLWMEKIQRLSKNFIFQQVLGLSIGYSTMIANMASSYMITYLLTQNLKKREFASTQVVFFFILNLIKIPINIQAEIITPNTAYLGLFAIIPMLIGGLLGFAFLDKIPGKSFRILVQALTCITCIKILLSSLQIYM
ncbi:MAG: putative membrane protein YfcA [Chlamydiales bacterium]|jgi:uncharacterized membrane protein YfcA